MRGTGRTATAVNHLIGHGRGHADLAGGWIEPHAAQVQRKGSVHRLGVLGKPKCQFRHHLSNHGNVLALQPLAHDLKHDLMLRAVAIA